MREANDDGQVLSAMFAAAERGDIAATDELFVTLYKELHRLARRQLFSGGRDLTLGATTLLHQAYLDMSSSALEFPDKPRFFAYAARAMRNLIVDYVRARKALKRGGEFHFTSDVTSAQDVALPAGLDALSDALDALAKVDAELARLVDLKFFAGFSFIDIAAMRGVNVRTVRRQWEKARLILRQLIDEDD